MKRDEAESIFGMVAAVYDLHPERAGELATVWVPALEELSATTTMEIVSAWMKGRGPETMPKIVAFVRDVHALEERRREAMEGAKVRRGVVDPPPLFWLVFQRLRDEGRDELLPEMEVGWRQLYPHDSWPPEGRTLIDTEEYEALLEWAKEVPIEQTEALLFPDPACPVCEDEGQVQVGRAIYFLGGRKVTGSEETAPCPVCEKGQGIEFPLDTVGPWGTEGFWRGRSHRVVRRGVVEVG